MNWEPIKPSQEKIDRQQLIDDILAAFGIPPSMFGDMTVEGTAIVLDDLPLLPAKKECAE